MYFKAVNKQLKTGKPTYPNKLRRTLSTTNIGYQFQQITKVTNHNKLRKTPSPTKVSALLLSNDVEHYSQQTTYDTNPNTLATNPNTLRLTLSPTIQRG